jgi:hypothetical protein
LICLSDDGAQYLVFDYLNDYKTIQVVEDFDLPKKILNFIQTNLFPIESIVVTDRRKLGPYKYDRAELLKVAVPPSTDNRTSFNKALQLFCSNQSINSKSHDQ